MKIKHSLQGTELYMPLINLQIRRLLRGLQYISFACTVLELSHKDLCPTMLSI